MKLCVWYRFGALALSLNIATFAVLGVSIPSQFITFDSNNNIVAAKSSFNGTTNSFAVARYTPAGILDVTFGGAAVAAATATSLTNGTSNTSFAGSVFPVAGIVTTSFTAGDDVANSVVVDSQNKITAAGSAANALGIRSFALVRYNVDGTLDTTFNPNTGTGIVITSINGADSAIGGVVLDAASRFVTAGFTTQSNGSLVLAIGRYNANGTLDTTFSPTSLLPGVSIVQVSNGSAVASGVTLDAAGQIVVAGTLNTDSFVVARFNSSNGTLDTTFNPTGTQPGIVITSLQLGSISANSVIVDNNNKIVVSGVLTATSGVLSFVTIRYNPDGSLDTTFNPTGAVSGVPGIVITTPPAITPTELSSSINIDDNDNIIISGYAKEITFVNFASTVILDLVLVRYTPAGALDATFNSTGVGIVVTDVSIQTATQVGLDLTSTFINPVVTGQVGFTSDVPSDMTSGVFIDILGNIVIGGFSNNGQINNDLVVGRYLPAGALDITFDPLGPLPGVAFNNLAFNTVFFTTGRGPSPVFVSAFTTGGASAASIVPTIPIVLVIPPAFIAFPAHDSIVTTATPTISGGALPAAAISIFVNNMLMGTTVANADGHWFFRMAALPDNIYSVHTRASDVVGNISQPSSPIFFTVAAQAPAAPRIMSPQAHALFIHGSLEFEGTAQPNYQVTLYLNNQVLDRVIADSGGRWRYILKYPLANGVYTLYANVTNPASKTGPNSVKIPFSINSAFGKPPLIFSPTHNALIPKATVSISGTSGAHLPLAVVINNKPVARIMSDSQGNWRYTTSALPDGAYVASVQILDTSGRAVISSEPLTFNVYTQAPPKAVNNRAPIANKTIINEKTFTITGKAAPSAAITVYLDNKLYAQLKAEADGTWSTTITRGPLVSTGPHTVAVSQENSVATTRTISTLSFQFV